ncbi:MAG: hypothetical protein L6R41_007961 [Letrouitia leprolyta]|nr:MAG: hypothetical protein L6R41_007961 [Letrouitia leprolyta]
MSLEEEAVSQSSSSPVQSAQPRQVEIDDSAQRVFSNQEQSDDLSEDYLSDTSSDASTQSGRNVRTRNIEGLDKSPSATSTPVKKSPNVRPNKHHGPDSTWRSRIAPERQLAASLDQLRAKDLSIHLYNFYALKRQLIQDDQEAGLSSSSKDWVSSKSWTAWPMPPELVPRESDVNFWEHDDGQEPFVKFEALSSHETMQELLAAHAAKVAKERLSKREWEDPDVVSHFLLSNWESGNQSRIRELAGDSNDEEEDELMVLADDQLARRILQPSLNHVLTKLDTLLMGLHHARSSYSSFGNPPFEPQGMVDDEYSTDNKRKRKVVSRDRSQKCKGRRKCSSTDPENLSSADNDLTPARGRRSGSDRKRVGQPSRSRSKIDRLGLRDWSDILGVVSMYGWNRGVVAKTAVRCSDLFDEGIVFRTLYEGSSEYKDLNVVPKISTAKSSEEPEPIEVQRSSAQLPAHQGHGLNEKNDNMLGGVHIDGFLQPIPKHTSWARKRRLRKS